MKATKLFSILATFFLSISFFSVDLSAQWTPAPDDTGIVVVSTTDRVFINAIDPIHIGEAALRINTKRYGLLMNNPTSPANTAGYFIRLRNVSDGAYQNVFEVNKTGQVRIGDMTDVEDLSGYGLLVNSGIMSKRVKCALVPYWSDYVFEEDYELNSLKEVEDFITANKHLPNVPSAETVEANGIDVATMDATLLRQIEELWLHTIELNKEKEALETENDGLEAKYNALLQRVEALEIK